MHPGWRHGAADAQITITTSGHDVKLDIVLTVAVGDKKSAEHEVGHVQDAPTNTDQFKKDAVQDAKNKGGPNQKPHDERPVERRADKSKEQVEQERKEFRRQPRPDGF